MYNKRSFTNISINCRKENSYFLVVKINFAQLNIIGRHEYLKTAGTLMVNLIIPSNQQNITHIKVNFRSRLVSSPQLRTHTRNTILSDIITA